MRFSTVLFAAALVLLTGASAAHAADAPPFLMRPVEPPKGWHYEGCTKVEEANGKPVLGGPNCRLVSDNPSEANRGQPRARPEQEYDEPTSRHDRDEEGDTVRAWRREMARYCRAYPWAPACVGQQRPAYAYAAPAVDWRGVEYFWGKVLGERPYRRDRVVIIHRGGGHQGWGGRDQRVGSSSGGYDPRNPGGGQRGRR